VINQRWWSITGSEYEITYGNGVSVRVMVGVRVRVRIVLRWEEGRGEFTCN